MVTNSKGVAFIKQDRFSIPLSEQTDFEPISVDDRPKQAPKQAQNRIQKTALNFRYAPTIKGTKGKGRECYLQILLCFIHSCAVTVSSIKERNASPPKKPKESIECSIEPLLMNVLNLRSEHKLICYYDEKQRNHNLLHILTRHRSDQSRLFLRKMSTKEKHMILFYQLLENSGGGIWQRPMITFLLF